MGTIGPHLTALLGDWLTVLFTIARVSVVYTAVLAFLFLTGRRTIGELTPYDLVGLLLLSNVVQNAMIGPDDSLIGGILGAATLLIITRLVSRSVRLRRRLERKPALLITRGRVLYQRLRTEGITIEDLQAAARERGIGDLGAVEEALLEMDGVISIIPKRMEPGAAEQ